jgi:hypothetical protein
MHALTDDEQVARLEKKVDDGFAEMRTEFRALRGEIKGMETGLRGEIEAGDGSLRGEIAALHRLMFQLFGGLCVSMIFGFAGIIIAMLTHHV